MDDRGMADAMAEDAEYERHQVAAHEERREERREEGREEEERKELKEEATGAGGKEEEGVKAKAETAGTEGVGGAGPGRAVEGERESDEADRADRADDDQEDHEGEDEEARQRRSPPGGQPGGSCRDRRGRRRSESGWDELVEVVEAARERDALVHFDGARLWETVSHFGHELSEIAGLADSVYVSFYKSLGGLSGAALVGPESFVEEARAWRHRYGGNLFQQHPAALAALVGLERELPRLPEYVAHAHVVAEALREGFEAAAVPWFRFLPEVPHTHEFCVWLGYEPDVLTEAAVRQAEETGVTLFHRWYAGIPEGPPGMAFTEVSVTAPGLEWTASEVKKAVRRFMEYVHQVEREK